MSKKQPISSEPEFPVQPTQPGGFKALAIQSLRTIIRFLDEVVAKLESQLTPATVTSDSRLKPLLSPVRRFLPASLNEKLSDGILVAGMVALVLLIFITKLGFTSKKPAPIIAEKPPAVEEIQPPPSPEAQLFPKGAEPFPDLVEVISPSEESTPIVENSEPKLDVISTPITTAENPSETAELTDENLPQLTPEQYLMAAIQKQMNETTRSYGNELVQSVRINMPASVLKVTVSNDWYQMEAGQQNQFSEEILKETLNLNFAKLEIINAENKVIARSPVVGSEMIILERS